MLRELPPLQICSNATPSGELLSEMGRGSAAKSKNKSKKTGKEQGVHLSRAATAELGARSRGGRAQTWAGPPPVTALSLSSPLAAVGVAMVPMPPPRVAFAALRARGAPQPEHALMKTVVDSLIPTREERPWIRGRAALR